MNSRTRKFDDFSRCARLAHGLRIVGFRATVARSGGGSPHASRYGSHGDIYVNKKPTFVPDPGSDNRYFSDTVTPSYPLGPAFDSARGGWGLLPGHTDIWFSGHQDIFGGS